VLITVPSGVEGGSRIRLKGQGGKGTNGGPAGDLLITFQVRTDPAFRREGMDIVTTATVNVAQATLGGRVSVPTLDEKTVALRIPPGTASGTRFRVRGQGIPKEQHRGDLIVEVGISVPARLSPEQEQKMREFASSAGLEV